MDNELVFLARLRAVVNASAGTELTIMGAIGCLEIVKQDLLQQLELEGDK